MREDRRHRHRPLGDPAGGPSDQLLYEQVEAAHESAGWFRFYFDEDRWEWSPEVERMHGYQPGTVTPTTKLVLAHKHPDDYRAVADVIDRIRTSREPFTSRHRICDKAGNVHHVLVVADELRDERGAVVGTHGYYIDVTPTLATRQEQVTSAVTQIADNRGPIEQAKGMLMAIYNMTAEQAFELLTWVSQKHNVKVRRLAERLVADFSAVGHDGQMPPRSVYDNLLMTAHQRLSTDLPGTPE